MLQRFHRYERIFCFKYFVLHSRIYIYVYNMLKKLANGKKQFSEKWYLWDNNHQILLYVHQQILLYVLNKYSNF